MPAPWTPASATNRRRGSEMPRRAASVTGRRSFGWLDWPARVLGFMVFITVLTHLITRGVISWTQFLIGAGVVFAAAMVVGQLLVVPRLARKASKHPRITVTDDWECPLTPADALERIRAELADLEPTVDSDDSCLQVVIGSDVTFRRRGASSEIGWQALPLLATVRAAPSGTGCRITADVRDNLGWYPDPPAVFVEDEIIKRNTALIQRAKRVTGPCAR